MKTFLSSLKLCVLISAVTVNLAQGQGFEKNYGGTTVDAGNAVATLSDGSFVTAGYTASYGNGGNDVFVVKTDAQGNLLWSRVIGGSGDDFAYSIACDVNDNIVIAGQTNSFGAGGNDIYLIKIGKNGNILWTKTIGGTGNEYAKGIALLNGKYFLAGATTSSGAGGSDMYLVKTDTSGNVVLTKTFGYAGDDYATAIETTYDTKIILAGRTSNFGISSPVYVVRCKQNGDTIWTRNFIENSNTSTSSALNVKATAVRELNDHSCIVTGFGYPYNGGYGNMFHLKIDPNGNKIYSNWSNLLADYGNGVAKTSDGGYVVCDEYCNYGCRIRLIKYNASGVQQWQHDYLPGYGLTYNEYSAGYGLKELPDKGFIVSGTTAWTQGLNDALLVRTDSAGNSNSYVQPVITASGPTTFCAGGSVKLTAPAGYKTYKWVRVNGNAASYLDATSSITITNLGGTYYCVLTNSSGILISTVTAVTINPLPAASISASGPTSYCASAGQTLTLNAPAGYTYQWKLNGNPIAGATSSSYSVPSSGTYTVTVTNTCGSATSTGITVNNGIAPSSVISCASGNCFYPPTCWDPNQAQLQVSNAGTGTTYNWIFNGSTVQSGISNAYYPNQTGNYTCNVTNTCGSSTSIPYMVNQSSIYSYNIFPDGPTNGCGVTSVTLNAPSEALSYYQWYVDGASIAGANSNTYIATQTGNYTVDFDTYNCGIESSDPLYFQTNTSPAPLISATGSVQICSGSVSLTASVTGAGVSYNWTKDGSNISGAYSQSYIATTTGAYRCIVNSPQCGITYTNVINVEIGNPVGTVSIYPSTICANKTANLSYSTARPGDSFQWKLNGATIVGATASSYTANSPGSYTCTITNTCGTMSSNAVSLAVNPAPASTITVAGTTALCPGGSVILTAPAGTGFTYQWFKGPYYISGSTLQSYAATVADNYYVRVTNSYSCSSTSSLVNITNGSMPVATIKASDYPQICAGESLELKAGTGAGYAYLWKKNGNPIAGATDSIYNSGNAGSYSLTVTNACGSSSSGDVVITKINNPASTITANGPLTFCAGGSVLLSTNSGNGYTYQWKKNGAAINGAINQNYTATAQGTYKVTVTNNNGCSKISSTGVTVTVPCKNGENLIEKAMAENMLEAFVYPNPAKEELMVTFNMEEELPFSITINDVIGKAILNYNGVTKQGENTNKLLLSDIKPGIYFLEIKCDDLKQVVKVVVN